MALANINATEFGSGIDRREEAPDEKPPEFRNGAEELPLILSSK
jgi:hypothetical protein